MKKTTLLLALTIFGTMVTPTVTMANEKKGHRLYKKKMQRKCKMAGSLFARKHTQDEWEKLKETKAFRAEAQKICPAMDFSKFSDKQWNDLYDFSYIYGIGGKVPNGCDPK
ncbi:hypothetical protein [Sulfurovum sp. NBC37-1]|uniref:hypothetical protein n=1 Tax=Sulfurovum sp. (strain NBC37-1) TaxID=387093 RepID=UPI0001587D1A|nr:hypothetical protein [Sulfurovum sp. NBC37-1]BAF72607.1 hypothetical protein SUN_1657 [Sulfurovum sp. NBC37-1]